MLCCVQVVLRGARARQAVVGVGAGRYHTALCTGTEVLTTGRNLGQLGYEANYETQITPRAVGKGGEGGGVEGACICGIYIRNFLFVERVCHCVTGIVSACECVWPLLASANSYIHVCTCTCTCMLCNNNYVGDVDAILNTCVDMYRQCVAI